MTDSRWPLALVGGGAGSFIGNVHRMAAGLDGRFHLVAGAFSSHPDRAREAASRYTVDPARAYADYRAMIAAEAARADGARVIAIAAPNHLHLPVARAALEAGMAVISDKPATATLEEAIELRAIVTRSRAPYALTYTYTGYPMLREARHVCLSGALGEIRKAVVEYPQGWLAEDVENRGSRQALWRTDPAQAGHGGCIGDIGGHAFNALEFVSGLRVRRLCAQLSTVVPGRALDDDCNLLLTLGAQEAPAVLHASQIATGSRNGLRLRLWGTVGGLDWCHEAADRLVIDRADGTTEIRHAATPGLSDIALAASRLPPGHPEGFVEAFANIYRDFADLIAGAQPACLQGIDEGVRGMAFVHHAITSSRQRQWVDFTMPNGETAR